jgi:hypothetical protein
MQSLTRQIAGMPPEFAGAFGFVGARVDQVSDELFSWHTELGFRPRRHAVDAGLTGAAPLLLPLTRTPYARNLLVGTHSAKWTAYFDARLDGGDPRGAVSVLGKRLGVPQVVVYAIPFRDDPDAIPGINGAVQWEYSPDGSATSRRAVSLIEGEGSSRFHFEAWGPVQSWETPEAYSSRKKRQRITPELVDEYCRAIGIEPFDPAFYAGPSILIERTT